MAPDSGGDLLDHPPADPLALVRQWVEAAAHDGGRDPFAVSLATATPDGAPSVRFVALEVVTDDGLVFCTSTASPKGRDIGANPRVALAAYWPESIRQVRVVGSVAPLPDEESDRLFDQLPRAAQASVATARQSEPLESEAELHRAVQELASSPEPITRPAEWQAMLVTPSRVELWAASEDKVHCRLAYTRTDDGWTVRRLQP